MTPLSNFPQYNVLLAILNKINSSTHKSLFHENRERKFEVLLEIKKISRHVLIHEEFSTYRDEEM